MQQTIPSSAPRPAALSPSEPEAAETDAALLLAIARRDESAFSLLYDRLAPVIFGLIMRIVVSRAEAEDVLQKVFWRVWERASEFQPDAGTPFAWVVTIARNLAIDHLRSIRRDQQGLQRARSLEPLGEPTETAHGFASVALGEKARAVRQVLAELQATEREAIELAFFQGLTQEEIATLTGVPVGTIKARIRRGMLKLKKPLQSLRGEGLR